MIKVGIPQGLFYFYQYPLWKTFFIDLGAQVITSGPTSQRTVDIGIEHSVDECCFPVKVYFGHIRQLINEDPDYIWAPRFISTEAQSYICPKFMGIPDMIRASFNPCPPLIDITVDCSRDSRQLWQDIYRVGDLFNCSKKQVSQAYDNGLRELKRVRVLTRQGYSPLEAIRLWESGEYGPPRRMVQHNLSGLCVGVLGHGYSLYDSIISLKLIEKLRNLGCRVVLLESCSRGVLESEAARLPKRMFWTLGRKMLGTALMMDKDPEIDGIVYLACFGCGPDSMVGDIIARKVRNKPYMLVTIDEHSGEGGLITRLEAFCDMLRRKKVKRHEGDLSSYGLHAHSP